MFANPILYDRVNHLQQRDGFKLIRQIKADLELKEFQRKDHSVAGNSRIPLTILDIGCGTGNETEKICEAFQPLDQIVAFDISKEMMEFARNRNNPQIPDGKIRYVEANICDPFEVLSKKLDLRENSVDLVVSIYCFHWIEDRRTALANIERFLKPSGRMYLVISTWNDTYPIQPQIVKNPKWTPYLIDAVAKLKNTVAGINSTNQNNSNNEANQTLDHINRPSEHSLYQLWRHLCLASHLDLTDIDFHYTFFPFESVKQFNDLIQGTNYWLAYIPIEKHPDFLQDLFDYLRINYVEGQIELQKQLRESSKTKNSSELFRINYNYATIVANKL